MPDKNLFIGKLEEDINSQIMIVFEDLRIRGFVTEESTLFDTQSTYSDLLDMNAAQAAGAGGSAVPVVGDVLGKLGEALTRAGGQGGARFIQQTIMSWDGSTRPAFIIGIKFVATKPGDDPRVPAVNLMKRCLPRGGGTAEGALASLVKQIPGIGESVLTAPNGYTGAVSEILAAVGEGSFSGSSQGITGTCSLVIGQWFRATNLILTQANFEVSRTTMQNGIPLVCEGRVHFEPYRWMTEDEFESCFVGVSGSALGSKWFK